MPSPVVKKIAKEALKGSYIHAVAVGCILIFTFLIAFLTSSIIASFAGFAGYIVTLVAVVVFALCPLFLGVLNFYRRLLWDQTDDTTIIFKYFSSFKQYKRAMRFVFLQGIRYVLTAAVLYSPCVLVGLLSNEKIYSSLDIALPIWSSNLWALNSLLAFIATMMFVFITLKYYLSSFIFVSNDDVDVSEAINMSNIISKRTGADYFGLVLSFAGWILISVFILPIIFVVPYFVTAYCVHCRYAISAYNSDVDVFNSANTPSFSVDEI